MFKSAKPFGENSCLGVKKSTRNVGFFSVQAAVKRPRIRSFLINRPVTHCDATCSGLGSLYVVRLSTLRILMDVDGCISLLVPRPWTLRDASKCCTRRPLELVQSAHQLSLCRAKLLLSTTKRKLVLVHSYAHVFLSVNSFFGSVLVLLPEVGYNSRGIKTRWQHRLDFVSCLCIEQMHANAAEHKSQSENRCLHHF